MSIRIVVSKSENTAAPSQGKKNIFLSDKNFISVGSAKDCDITLDDLDTKTQVTIHKSKDRKYSLERNGDSAPVIINSKPVLDKDIQINNGDEILIGPYLLRFNIEFSQIEQNQKVGILAYLSPFLIIFILILEVGIIIFLPKQIGKRQIWGEEIRKERTLELVDVLRNRCNSLAEAEKDTFYVETIRLIQKELDKMAVYLRKFVNDMDAKQISLFFQDTSYFESILNKLESGEIYPEQISIDMDTHLIRILEEYGVKPL